MTIGDPRGSKSLSPFGRGPVPSTVCFAAKLEKSFFCAYGFNDWPPVHFLPKQKWIIANYTQDRQVLSSGRDGRHGNAQGYWSAAISRDSIDGAKSGQRVLWGSVG